MPTSGLFALALAVAAAPNPVVVTGHFWAPFISPMGEPFRPHSAGDDMLATWFRQADANADGILTVGEMEADAARFFATLDTDGDGEIGPDELVHYEWEVAPDVQVLSRTRPVAGQAATGPGDRHGRYGELSDGRKSRFRTGNSYGFEGAARYSLLNIPEPVAAADANLDRGISLSEFKQAAADRFALLDSRHQNRLTLAQLEALLPNVRSGGHSKNREDSPDTRIAIPVPPGN